MFGQGDRPPAGVDLSKGSLQRDRLNGWAGGGMQLDDDDGLAAEALDDALKQTPRGALALAGLTTALLLAAWLAIYVFVFLPRGSVG